MDNDRTLLEKAAKAARGAGMTIIDSEAGPQFFERMSPDGFECYRIWRPLMDDGEALRLAHALRMNIEPQTTMGGRPVGFNVWPYGRGECGHTEDGTGLDSLRLAIVRAAAAIGEQT